MKNLETRTSRLESKKKKSSLYILKEVLTWIGYFTALPILLSLLHKVSHLFAEIFELLNHFLTNINSYLIYKWRYRNGLHTN